MKKLKKDPELDAHLTEHIEKKLGAALAGKTPAERKAIIEKEKLKMLSVKGKTSDYSKLKDDFRMKKTEEAREI